MAAFALYLGFMASFGPLGDLPDPPEVRIEVRVLKGDPLGSPADGTVEVLCMPRMTLLSGQKGDLHVGQQVPIVGADGTVSYEPVGVMAKFHPVMRADGSVRLDTEVRLRERSDGLGIQAGANFLPGFAERSVSVARVVKPGERVRVRVAADSPTDQTWVELTVARVE